MIAKPSNTCKTKTVEAGHNRCNDQTAQIVYALTQLYKDTTTRMHEVKHCCGLIQDLDCILKYGIERYTLYYSIEDSEQVIAMHVEGSRGRPAWFTNRSFSYEDFLFDYSPQRIRNIEYTDIVAESDYRRTDEHKEKLRIQRCKEIQKITRGFEHVNATYPDRNDVNFKALLKMQCMGFDNHKMIRHDEHKDVLSIQVCNPRIWCLFECTELHDYYKMSHIVTIRK
jgi:hypothetical protein